MKFFVIGRTFTYPSGKQVDAYFKEKDGYIVKYTKRIGKADMFLDESSATITACEKLKDPGEHFVCKVEKKRFGWKKVIG